MTRHTGPYAIACLEPGKGIAGLYRVETQYNSALANEIIANQKPSTMDIQTTALAKAHIIKLVGRLDTDSTNDLTVAWERCVENGALYIVLDLSELRYISSAGLGSIVRLAQKLTGLGGSVFLCGVSGLVKNVFEMTGLLTIFRVFDSPEAACQSI